MNMIRLIATFAFLFLFPGLQSAGVLLKNASGVFSSLTGPAHAAARSGAPAWPGPFPVVAVKVKDGDTLDIIFQQGPCGRAPCPHQELSLRLSGVDAPEIHACRKGAIRPSCAGCPAELALGRQAKDFADRFVSNADLRVTDLRPDKYGGRIVGELQAWRTDQWVSLSRELLDANLAVPYDGGKKRKPWCRRVP